MRVRFSCSARWGSVFPALQDEIRFSSGTFRTQWISIILHAMHEKMPAIKGWENAFLFQRQISKRNSQKLLCAFAFTAFYFGAVVLNPDSNEPHVFLPAVCSGKDLADLCHTGSFCVKQKPSELLSRGPRATDHEPKSKCLLLLPCLVAPNTEAAGGWSVY